MSRLSLTTSSESPGVTDGATGASGAAAAAAAALLAIAVGLARISVAAAHLKSSLVTVERCRSKTTSLKLVSNSWFYVYRATHCSRLYASALRADVS